MLDAFIFIKYIVCFSKIGTCDQVVKIFSEFTHTTLPNKNLLNIQLKKNNRKRANLATFEIKRRKFLPRVLI